MKLKRFLWITILILMVSAGGQATAADTTKVVVNGKYLTFDVPPTVIQGRTLVPVRAIFEALGVDVTWDSATRTVVATKPGIKIELPVDQKYAKKNGQSIQLDVPATVVAGRTLVPARFVAESLGSYVDWDGITSTVIVSSSPLLKVHYINVGQGDSIFIDYGDYDVLIDGGDEGYGQTVINYLKALNTDDIEILVATHPDADHIGGLDDVLSEFKVEYIIDSGVAPTTQTYNSYWAAVNAEKAAGAQLIYDDNMTLDLGNGIKLEMYETGDENGSNNNNSVVAKLTYNGVSFLFTGDMEEEAEAKILNRSIDADILKVGHHGSRSSSSAGFLAKVTPEVAVISAGLDNKYGHPHAETLDALGKYTPNIYGTWLSGNVVITSDGTNYFVNTDKKVQASQGSQVTQQPTTVTGIVIKSIDRVNEIAVIENTSGHDVSMSGWKLVSTEGSQTYSFPASFILKAGKTVNITSGPKATDYGDTHLKWTTGYIWNNDKDSGELYNSTGKIVSIK